MRAARAQYHADPDFMCSLPDQKRHQAVNADRGQQQRHAAENAEQHSLKSLLTGGVGNEIIHRAKVKDG